MTFEELKDKALSLPYEPGVYIMQDKAGTCQPVFSGYSGAYAEDA